MLYVQYTEIDTPHLTGVLKIQYKIKERPLLVCKRYGSDVFIIIIFNSVKHYLKFMHGLLVSVLIMGSSGILRKNGAMALVFRSLANKLFGVDGPSESVNIINVYYEINYN